MRIAKGSLESKWGGGWSCSFPLKVSFLFSSLLHLFFSPWNLCKTPTWNYVAFKRTHSPGNFTDDTLTVDWMWVFLSPFLFVSNSIQKKKVFFLPFLFLFLPSFLSSWHHEKKCKTWKKRVRDQRFQQGSWDLKSEVEVLQPPLSPKANQNQIEVKNLKLCLDWWSIKIPESSWSINLADLLPNSFSLDVSFRPNLIIAYWQLTSTFWKCEFQSSWVLFLFSPFAKYAKFFIYLLKRCNANFYTHTHTHGNDIKSKKEKSGFNLPWGFSMECESLCCCGSPPKIQPWLICSVQQWEGGSPFAQQNQKLNERAS